MSSAASYSGATAASPVAPAAIDIRGAVLERVGAPRPYTESRPLSVRNLSLSPPGPDEVLVRIEAAGVCHSDLSVVDGSRPRPLPMLLDHEAAGIVVSAGDNVPPAFVGRRVVTTFLPRCGECPECGTDGRMPCRRGSASNAAGTLLDGSHHIFDGAAAVHHHLGVSGFATHAVLDHRSIVPVGDDIPADLAAVLGCAVLTGGGALVNATDPTPDSTVAIVGLGGVGMAALLVARAVGVRRLIAVDQLSSKLSRALELGADEALAPRAAVDAGISADIVIEAAGHPAAFETAFDITAPGGTTVTVGLPAPGARAGIEVLRITAQARTIKGSYLGSAVPSRDLPRYEQLWREGRLPLEELISSRIALEDINGAMDRLADGSEIRQIITLAGAAHGT